MRQTLTLEELKQRPIEEILREIVEQEAVVVVRLPGGEEVLLEAKPTLRPLPVLEGYVPEGWQEVVYAGKG